MDKPTIIDHTRQPDEAERVLRWDVDCARQHVERLERKLGKARRVLLNREKELATYQATGKTPRRAGFVRTIEQVVSAEIQHVTGKRDTSRGSA